MRESRLIVLGAAFVLAAFFYGCANQPTTSQPASAGIVISPPPFPPTNHPTPVARKSAVAVKSPYGSIGLAWDYPPDELTNGMISFNVYSGSTLGVPLAQWTIQANTTNQQITLPIIPGLHFFYVTATNSEDGQESIPSPTLGRQPIPPLNSRISVP